MSRIAQVTNFVGPYSGGIRTVLANLATGYEAAGHEVLQIVPGPRRRLTQHDWGERLELPGRALPGTGYSVLTARAVCAALPTDVDRLEVHDRTTLRGLGNFARHAGIPALVVSHERLDRLVEQWTHRPLPSRLMADASNRRLSADFDAVVCTTEWAAVEFRRLSVPNLRLVPLGVDHVRFTPHAAPSEGDRRRTDSGRARLAMAIRLSPEKRVDNRDRRARRAGPAGASPARLVPGWRRQGPQVSWNAALPGFRSCSWALRRRPPAPVRAAGQRRRGPRPRPGGDVRARGAGGDGERHPGGGAPRQRAGGAGRTRAAGGSPPGCGYGFADAVEHLLGRPADAASRSARAQALRFDWTRTVTGFLAVHGLARHDPVVPGVAPGVAAGVTAGVTAPPVAS